MMKKVVMFLIGMALVVSGTQAKVLDAGSITAGGYLDNGQFKVHHTFALDCVDIGSSQNRLSVDWDNAWGNYKFQLDALSPLSGCSGSTYTGSGTGTLNGLPATVTFSFTDNGEPGSVVYGDYGMIEITGNTFMHIDGYLVGGNYQWH